MKHIAIAVLMLGMTAMADEPGPKGCPVGPKGDVGPNGQCPVARPVERGLKTFSDKMQKDVGGSLKTGARKFKNFFTGGKK